MPLKLYSVSDGPPSLAVRQLLAYLDLPFELINVDFGAAEHMTQDYAKKNPQKEIPVLQDDGFFLSESNAILQYLCDKYAPGSDVYPKDSHKRYIISPRKATTEKSSQFEIENSSFTVAFCMSAASVDCLAMHEAIVNHRLCFNLSTYYAYISAYTMAPIFFDYERTPLGLKKVNIALDNFNTYLKTLGGRYAAADHVTIADFQLVAATMTLEAIDFDFSHYAEVSKWYKRFKSEHPKLWSIVEGGMEEIKHFAANPPDLSHMEHPLHPIRVVKN